jgi:hypothetical protein
MVGEKPVVGEQKRIPADVFEPVVGKVYSDTKSPE